LTGSRSAARGNVARETRAAIRRRGAGPTERLANPRSLAGSARAELGAAAGRGVADCAVREACSRIRVTSVAGWARRLTGIGESELSSTRGQALGAVTALARSGIAKAADPFAGRDSAEESSVTG
jgi:hypothetical protein